MTASIASSDYSPRSSWLYWSRDWLDAANNQRNCKSGFPLSYVSASLAVANLATLPLTLVLDPVIAIWDASRNRNNTPSHDGVGRNLLNKIIFSPINHTKVFLISVCITAVAIPIFYGFSITAAFAFNLTLLVPRIGPYLGCFTVVWIMHFPLGWYAVQVSTAFASC